MAVLKKPTTLRRFFYILKYYKDLKNSKTFLDLTNELHLCNYGNHRYTDAKGYDAISKKGKKIEFKYSNHRKKDYRTGKYTNSTIFNKCGDNKSIADQFYLWDMISETLGVFTSREIKKYVTKDGIVNVSFGSKKGTPGVTSRTLEIVEKFTIL